MINEIALARASRVPDPEADARQFIHVQIAQNQGSAGSCEPQRQDLPEWLLRKHAARLNWGQVSEYQVISREFAADYSNLLNPVRLARNVGLATKLRP